MKAYLITVFASVLLVSLILLLAPSGKRGLGEHLRLLAALFLVTVIVSPLTPLISSLSRLPELGGSILDSLPTDDEEEAKDKWQATLDGASMEYFEQRLTQELCDRFSIDPSFLRTRVKWKETDGALSPELVTVYLSGSAVWKDTKAIEDHVTSLLSCPCQTIIE